MSHRSCFLWFVTLFLLLSNTARPQQPVPASKPSEEVKAVQEKAVKLLETLAGQVDAMRSAENRARIGSNIADLLWEHNESRGRGLFGDAAEDIKAGFRDADSEGRARYNTLMVMAQLRRNIVMRIAKHEPNLALEFWRSTSPPPEVELPYYAKEGDKAIELQLAAQVAAKDPQLAMRFVRESLAGGFSMNLIPALKEIQRKDPVAAKTLYVEIVEKLRQADFSGYSITMDFATELVRSLQPPAVYEQSYKELLGIFVKAAQAGDCAHLNPEEEGPAICGATGNIFPQLEKYFGARVAGLRKWSDDPREMEIQSEIEDLSEKFENGTVEEVMALAKEHPARLKEIQMVAISKALRDGEMSTAREIAAGVSDETERAEMAQQLERYEKWSAMSEEQQLALLTTSMQGIGPEGQAERTTITAMRLGKNNRKTALRLLKQAGEILDSMKPGRLQIAGQIHLATAYCSLKSDRGFAIMQAVVPKVNELVSAAAILDRFDNDYFRDGEWSMTGEGSLGSLLTELAQNAGAFAWGYFDRAVNLAAQFERPEIRLMAQAKLAQGILAGSAKVKTNWPGSAGLIR